VREIQNARCWIKFIQFLVKEKPKFICCTVTTPIYYEAKLIGIIAKQILGPEVVVVHGGVHATALYKESLTDSMCDVVVLGEGELTLGEICQGRPYKDIRGIAYREDDCRYMTITAHEILSRLAKGEEAYFVQRDAVVSLNPYVQTSLPRPLMTTRQLDDLPFQDLDLYDSRRYHNPRVIVKSHPFIQFETSRGCPFACDFCSAEDEYRVLSPDRVIEEMKYYRDRGIREIRITDDQFLTDVRRGEIIAEKMLSAGLRFDINLGNGVRADRCTKKFLELFKRAGLYQAGAGFESGDQDTLDSMRKSLNMEKSLSVMELFRETGIEVVGFFIFGAEKETLASMQKTIDFAKALLPDYAKVTIYTPFPDTQAYARWKRRGLIVSERWDHYNIHKAAGVYRHPNPELTPAVLMEWYGKFYQDFYSNPAYIERQLIKSIRDGSIVWKIPTALRTFFPGFFQTSPMDNVRANYLG
jgi:anaerobic magnesium-protoporphyrin IX monomethyl ester cyclase